MISIVFYPFQFKDFLQLYNRLTELCFVHCADNFFTRQLSDDESNCLDKCVLKFSNVNQRVMTAYVNDQSIINERRMKEVEEQARVANEKAMAAAAAAATSAIPATDSSTSAIAESNLNLNAPIVQPAEVQDQSQSLAA